MEAGEAVESFNSSRLNGISVVWPNMAQPRAGDQYGDELDGRGGVPVSSPGRGHAAGVAVLCLGVEGCLGVLEA